MLAVLSDLPDPEHEEQFSFEYKWDGVRAISYWDGHDLRIESRNLLDITGRYPELQPLGDDLGRRHPAVLDGEIVALDELDRPSFAKLQHRMHADPSRARLLMRQIPVWYFIFDVLWLDEQSTMHLPFIERRDLLEGLGLAGPAWQTSPKQIGEGCAMLEAARAMRMEGVVAKRLNSIYEPGRRSPDWRKIKIVNRQELVIGGWIPQEGSAQRIGSLLLGYYEDAGPRGKVLKFAGGVGTGFADETHRELYRLLKKRERDVSPFAERVPKAGEKHYVQPDLVAEVEYRRWPRGAQIQQAAFKGLRDDKDAASVVKEV
jgi:bifunctional non-homologous end joining protein LigD